MFKNAIYGAKELPRLNRTYDPVLISVFWRIWGIFLYDMGYQMIELMYLFRCS